MEKLVKVIMPVLLAVMLVVAIGTVAYVYWQPAGDPAQNDRPPGQEVTILDAKGNPLITVDRLADIYDAEQWAYLELVLKEMADVIANKEGCTPEEARKKLFDRECQIHTVFDSDAFHALQAAQTRWKDACNTAAAITDLNGNLLAVYCSDTENKQVNYLAERRSPYSSFKALSVYTPAVEKSVVNWSTMYQDSPYKQLADDDGNLQDWPKNATGIYSNEDLTVYEALRQSLNTVAVKCLENVGITESIEFLQTSFGIPLVEEEYVAENYGEEEVIGNIALGYLETGITPVEMVGYYQIFANGGKYTEPKTIQSVSLADGTVWYTRQTESSQVISAATADTMNKLLQGVVAEGGTGEMAYCSDVEVAGKTGTGDDYADNWFVGVTPGYSLAIWHGQHDSNQAEEMFAAVIQKLYSNLPNANRRFITHQNLYQIAYCAHSGKAFSPDCGIIDVGYYASKDVLPVCDTCNTTKKER